MFYTPRFSPSASGGRGDADPGLVRSPVPHRVSPRRVATSRAACWLCGRACEQPGFPGAPRLFFPPTPPPSSSAVADADGEAEERQRQGLSQGRLRGQSIFSTRSGRGDGARGGGTHTHRSPAANTPREPSISSFTLCDHCGVDNTDGDSTFWKDSGRHQKSTRDHAHSTEYVEHVSAYKELLTMLSRKVLRASQRFSNGGRRPPGDGDVVVVQVTESTSLARTTPQLQGKLIGMLLSHLEDVTDASSSSLPSHDAGPRGRMSQEERNAFLREMMALERALAHMQTKESVVAPAVHGTAHQPSLTGTRRPITALFSSSPSPHQPRSRNGTDRDSQQPPQTQPSPPQRRTSPGEARRMERIGASGNDEPREAQVALSPRVSAGDVGGSGKESEGMGGSNGRAGRTLLEGMVEDAMWRAANVDRAQQSTRRSRSRCHPSHSEGSDATHAGASEDDDDEGNVLLNYFAHRLRDPRRRAPSRAVPPPQGRCDTSPPHLARLQRAPSASSPPPGVPDDAALVSAQEQRTTTELQELEGMLENEVVRRRQAEAALLDAHQRIASLEGVTNSMGERLLTQQLSFSPRFHLDYLNDFYGNVVTFFQLFCLRKSMLFAEEVSAILRDVSRRSLLSLRAGSGRRTTSLSPASRPSAAPDSVDASTAADACRRRARETGRTNDTPSAPSRLESDTSLAGPSSASAQTSHQQHAQQPLPSQRQRQQHSSTIETGATPEVSVLVESDLYDDDDDDDDDDREDDGVRRGMPASRPGRFHFPGNPQIHLL